MSWLHIHQGGEILSTAYAELGNAFSFRIKVADGLADSSLEFLLQQLMESLPDFRRPSHFAEAAWAIAK